MPGSVIRKYRELRNYTQEYVSKEMKISQNAYSKIENNYTQLTVKHIKELSRILEVSILDLLKDNFEIHKPGDMQVESISKENLTMLLDNISNKLKTKPYTKHDFYPVIMTMLQAVDNTFENIK